MNREIFKKIEEYMLLNCGESVHDKEHIYRVLYNALDIAETEENIDLDVLVTACLLHDIGRPAQLKDSSIDHAEYGSKMAYRWLKDNCFEENFSCRVSECILCHRYRGGNIPESAEAKILYDADKIDAAGFMGISRTLEYKGVINEPIYTVKNRIVQEGTEDKQESFFTEYIHKLKNVYGKMLTARGREIAEKRRSEAEYFYNSLYGYLNELYFSGNKRLGKFIDD